MPLNIEVTQFPNGIGTRKDNSVLIGVPSPIDLAMSSFDDLGQGSNFLANFSATAIAGGVTVTRPLSSSGVLRQVTGGAGGDGNEYNGDDGAAAVDSFEFATGREAWYAARVMIDVVNLSTLILGFVPNSSAIAPADGVYIRKASGATLVELIVENNGTAQSAVDLGNIAADTWYEFALFWDGIDKVSAQFTGPDGVVGGGGNIIPGANLPSVGLDPTVTVQENAAAAVTMDLDYVLFGGSRS
jgi:hypothetical protein